MRLREQNLDYLLRENATLRSALERIAHECRHVESMAGGCVGPTVRSNRGMIVNCPACFAKAALAASAAAEEPQP